MKNWIKDNFLASWTPFEKGLFLTDVLLLGILIGWLSNNSWEIGEKDKEEQEQEEE